jgi:2-polyprenyl-6-methoxyphenol hydroxylase-like FAD-dependent oxidoreductase
MTQSGSRWDVVIVGGGHGGWTLALLLGRQGFKVALLDRQPAPIAQHRGEIIQPNGIKVLDHLGLLPDLLDQPVHRNRLVHFREETGALLCTVDYATLPAPYDYSLILMPQVFSSVFLARFSTLSNVALFWGATFESILWEEDRVAGVVAQYRGRLENFHAPMVVGADGARSTVREAFGIPHRLHPYSDGYVATVVDGPPDAWHKYFKQSLQYYLGRRAILALFPVSSRQIYLLYLIPGGNIEAVRAAGLPRLKEIICGFNPEVFEILNKPLDAVQSWAEVPYFSPSRVRCERWVVQGGALLGDAAHAMNPHVAQGRNSAMEDAVCLASVLTEAFRRGDFSPKSLADYETARRPDIERLQRLGDEMEWTWNSGWPPMVWARNRIFRAVGHNPRLHKKVLETAAGLQINPLNTLDKAEAIWQG